MESIVRRFPAAPLDLGTTEIPIPPIFTESPLAALARSDPPAATSIMNKILNLQRRERKTKKDLAQMELLRAASNGHTSQIIEFIRSNPDKKHIHIVVESSGFAGDNAFFFGRGQRICLRTSFVGNAW